MKRSLYIFLFCIMYLWAMEPLMAQTSFSDFEDDFQAFSDAIASSLPFNSAIGLQWSDAYIGNFPHFGVGATVGVTFIPWEAAEDVASEFGIDFESIYPGFVGTLGMPLPAWCVDGRIGGFGIPFDIGVKIGYLPEEAAVLLPEDMTFDYLLVGADFRYGILEDGIATPGLSIGIGVNYMAGNVSYDGVTGGNQIIDTGIAGPLNYLRITDPDVVFNWQSLSIDVKAQLSKNVIFITPYIGVAASYTVYAEAGGGLSSTVQHSNNAGGPWNDLDSGEIDTLESALGADISSTGILVSSSVGGWGLRAFGGASFNILIIKLNLHAMYNILNNAIGFSFNIRVQL